MQITLVQGILLAIMAFIAGVDNQTEAFFWFRPMTTAFLAGVILGDATLGCKCAAISELAFAGLLTVGGTVPPDALVAGVMTTVLAYTNPTLTPEAALGLSFGFALIMQYVGVGTNTLYAYIHRAMDKKAEAGDSKGLWRIAIGSLAIKATIYAVVVFLSSYAMQDVMATLVNSFPEWIVNGLSVAGGIMPAVGLALLLVVMMNNSNMPYLFIGFVAATSIEMGNILPLAIVGASVAVLSYMGKSGSKGGENDGI